IVDEASGVADPIMEAIMERQTAHSRMNDAEETRRFRTVNTKEYVDVLRELTNAGQNVNLLIAGNSMSPFLIHLRDYVFFEKPKRPLKKGDIVFYQRETGQYIMHRICKVDSSGYYMVGDAQTEIEGPLRREQIFGLVTHVQRKKKIEKPGTFWWEFFEHIWLTCLPIRPFLRGAYGLWARMMGRYRPDADIEDRTGE
ncbi:MAG: S24/S26 family peptidase, partial [Lachnospiraceae bacterium]|nr:S24/S26 family peptidase [Lachnospiraceae bacterium]